jgi:hypothetical protein
MKNELLIECTGNSLDTIVESTDNENKNIFLKGVFMQADIVNRNKRKYPLHEMNNAVLDFSKRIQEYGGVFGEADHPNSLNINMDRVSHVITEMYMDGFNAIGKAKVIKETPMGKILNELLKTGVKIGVSSRGTGQVADDGTVSNFSLVTVDAVITPSAPGAIPMSVYESLELDKSGRKVLSLSEALLMDKSAQKFFTKEIINFIKNIYNK